MAGGTSHIVQSLIVNTAIACAKGVAAVMTGSGAMLAETLHSAADCGNQLLLLLGVRRSRRPPDAMHPLGYGRALYFWSFMVALLLFAGGGGFSIYEGIHKLQHPEPVERVWIGVTILAFSLLLEGAATLSNLREMRKRRGAKPLTRYLRETKDSDLVVVFGENLAATVGLALALAALLLAHTTGEPRWDGAGSLAIGLVLVAVAFFLAIEVKGLLLGEAADSEIEVAAKAIAHDHPNLGELVTIITLQQGPGEVVAMLKVTARPELTARQISDAVNDYEKALRERRPEVKWSFIEVELKRDATEQRAAG